MFVETLETRQVLASVISEVLVSPLFGDNDVDQYVEIRGTPNETIAEGTYFVVVEGWMGQGSILSTINLSGLTYGANGFLVITQSGTPHRVDPQATHVTSNLPGFAGLPDNRWSDDSTLSDRFAFIFGDGTFMLVEAPQPPLPGTDADADDDGVLDGPAANWNVLDAVGLLNTTASPPRSYGKITFSSQSNYIHYPGSTFVLTDGGGYVGRVGASTGWSADDWASGTVIDGVNPNSIDYEFTYGTFGDPRPLEYAGRELDHIGTYNFDGGARGTVRVDSNGDTKITDADAPLPNVQVFADENGNGIRDSVNHLFVAGDYRDREGIDVTNLFPNATLTLANEFNNNIGFSITIDALNPGNEVFTSAGIPWFNSTGRLKVMFYNDADSVSIEARAASALDDTYGRLEIYDDDNNLLDFVQSAALKNHDREILSLKRATADIKYAIIYGNDRYLNSDPFAPFDRLQYSYPEFATTTDAQGKYAIEELPKGSYAIRASAGQSGQVVFANDGGKQSSFALNVANKDHLIDAGFGFRNNLPPVIATTNVLVAENTSINTIVGQVEATDPDPDQSLTYQFLNNTGPFGIDPITGAIKVVNTNAWDFENSSPIVAQLKVTDNFSASGATIRNVTISPTDVNEPPVLSNTDLSVNENSAAGTLVGRVVGLDPDAGNNGIIRYSIAPGGPANVFSIDAITGEIKVVIGVLLDFETQPTWTIPILAVDQGVPPLSDQRSVLVHVLDVNEAPKNILLSNRVSVAESANPTATTTVATITVVDDALGTNNLSVSGPNASMFTIVNGTLQFRSGTLLDFETNPTISVTVNADDPSVGSNPDVSVEFVLQITDVNEAPTAVSLSNVASISENTSTASALHVANINVVDDALGTNTLSLTGPDAARFELVGTELRFKANTPLNYEVQPSYKVTVNVDDISVGASPDVSSNLTVTLVDVNEAPTDLQLTVVSGALNEMTVPQSGVTVATLRAVDDAIGTNTFVLSGADAASYEVVGNELKLKAGVVLDYESKANYEVKVRVVDASLPVTTPPEVTSQLTVRNLPEVVSVTDSAGQPLTDNVKSIRVNFDSSVNLTAGAIRVFKSDAALDSVTTVFTSNVVNGKTVADLQLSGPYTVAGNLVEGDYFVSVDGLKIQSPTTLANGLDFHSNTIRMRTPPLPGTLEFSGPSSTLAGKSVTLQAKLTNLAQPITGNVDYKIDIEGDGTVDRTETAATSTALGAFTFPTSGSHTISVSVEKNGVLIAKNSFVIDVSPATTSTENWLSALDADRDNSVSPLDVLIIINQINSRAGGPVPYNFNQDVDRDGSISPLDVLALVNYLNSDPLSRTNTFNSLVLNESGSVSGLTNDVSVSGKINGSNRSLFVSLDGGDKKDISSYVKSDGTFAVQDAAITQLFGGISDGEHTLSLLTKTGSDFSIAMDKRFRHVTHQLADFQITTLLGNIGGAKVVWNSSSSGARYSVYASTGGAPPVRLTSGIAANETNVTLAAGTYSLYVEALDGAGNTKKSLAMTVTVI